jgi:RNA 2',3'-cyclic 3'-phosphodiesterase
MRDEGKGTRAESEGLSSPLIPHPSSLSSLRAFVAVEVGEEVTRRAAEILERLRPAAGSAVKWVEPRNFHLTVKFLGPTRPSDLPRLSEALRALAARAAPFDLEFAGVGAFPHIRRPQVVWLGVSAGQEALAELAGEAEELFETLGWAREQKPYRAHLTLGRTRTERRGARSPSRSGASAAASSHAAALAQALEAEREVIAGLTSVHRLVLVESQLHPKGPIYTVLDSFPFGGHGWGK